MGTDHTAEFDSSDLRTNKVVFILAYLWILFFIPLAAAPESRAGRFHANQGLLLLIFGVCFSVLASLFGVFGGVPVIGFLFRLCSGVIVWVGGAASLAAFIYQLVNIINGRAVELPVIGRFQLIK